MIVLNVIVIVIVKYKYIFLKSIEVGYINFDTATHTYEEWCILKQEPKPRYFFPKYYQTYKFDNNLVAAVEIKMWFFF